MKTRFLSHSICCIFVPVLIASLACFAMLLLEAQTAYANTVTIHDDAGIYYQRPSLSLLYPNAQEQISNSSDSAYEKEIKAQASSLPYDLEIYTHFGAGNNEQALSEQAQSDGYGKKEIVLEIDTNNQAIGIYGDKSIPLDDQDYQLVHDAFHQTLSQQLQLEAPQDPDYPYYRATISAVSALDGLFAEKSINAQNAQNAAYESTMHIVWNTIGVIVAVCIASSPILFRILSAQHSRKVRSAEFASSNRTGKSYRLPGGPLFVDPVFDKANNDSGDRGDARYPR